MQSSPMETFATAPPHPPYNGHTIKGVFGTMIVDVGGMVVDR